MSDFLQRLATRTLDPLPAILPRIELSCAAPGNRGREVDRSSTGPELSNSIAAADPSPHRLAEPRQRAGTGLKEPPVAHAHAERVETGFGERIEDRADALHHAPVLDEKPVTIHSTATPAQGASQSTQQERVDPVLPEPFHEESPPPASGKAFEAKTRLRNREQVAADMTDSETGPAGLRNPAKLPAGEFPGRDAPIISRGENDDGRSVSLETVRAVMRAQAAAENVPHTVAPARSTLEPVSVRRVGNARLPVTGPAREVPPAIEVTIGRIDVRAVVPPAPAARRVARGPRLTLDDYLKQHRSRSSPR
jgi:hypothetical protein